MNIKSNFSNPTLNLKYKKSDVNFSNTLIRGRFAPSPTGELHFGSLFTAFTSYLFAKSQNGKWLVRIEDIDTYRCNIANSAKILSILDKHYLHWDDEVIYQRKRLDIYNEYLEILRQKKLLYNCSCSRKKLADVQLATDGSVIYPGYCREKQLENSDTNSIRIKVPLENYFFTDNLQGYFTQNLPKNVGDFILKRADNVFAYNFVVVIDDYLQGINQIVRGIDLLDSTPRQLFLQNILNFTNLNYWHLPVIVHENGQKLSKQNKSLPITEKSAVKNLFLILQLLKQNPPSDLEYVQVKEIVEWGIANFAEDKIPREKNILLPVILNN